jgi:hypothetical protein
LQLFWKSLCPPVLQYHGECDMEGNMITLDKKNDELVNIVHRKLISFRMIGLLKVIAGLLVNSVWIILVMMLQNNVAYNPN